MLAVIWCDAVLAAAPYEEWCRLYDYDAKAALDVQEQGVQDRDGIKVHDLSNG